MEALNSCFFQGPSCSTQSGNPLFSSMLVVLCYNHNGQKEGGLISMYSCACLLQKNHIMKLFIEKHYIQLTIQQNAINLDEES